MPLVRSIDKSVREVREDLRIFKKETDSTLTGLRQDISSLKQDVYGLNQEVSILRDDTASLKNDVSTLKGDVKSLGVRMDGFDKRLDDMHQSQTRWFMLLGILVAIAPIAVALIQGFIAR